MSGFTRKDTKRLVAVDPGLRTTAVALFLDGTLSEIERYTPVHLRNAQGAIALQVFLDARLVIEFPQAYRGGKSKGDPNGLLRLAHLVGQLNTAGKAELVAPATWAGQVPKATSKALAGSSPRALRIRAALSEAERALVDWTCDDVIDAVGIGLWALGRLKPRRRYPGATE
jgi:hypothetical protein